MSHFFTLHTPDGAQIFGCNDPSNMRHEVCARLDKAPDSLLIEVDHRRHPAKAFPFTVWSRHWDETRGSMHPHYTWKLNA